MKSVCILITFLMLFLTCIPSLAARDGRSQQKLSQSYKSSVVKQSSVLDFHDWKKLEISRAQTHLDQVSKEFIQQVARLQSHQTTHDASRPSVSADRSEASALLKQAQANLNEARDLSVGDYYVLYLRTRASKDEMLDGIGRMNPQEVLDLLNEISQPRFGVERQDKEIVRERHQSVEDLLSSKSRF